MNINIEPLSFYLEKEDKPLLFHLLDVGQGLMSLVVFPDNTTFIYDCNITEDNKDNIIQYLTNNLPLRWNNKTNKNERWIDIFVCSHRDIDHLRGLDILNENFPIHSIWDSEQCGASTSSNDYQYYMNLRRIIKEKFGEKKLVTPKAKDIVKKGAVEIHCLSPFENCEIEDETKKQHTKCIVLSIKYANKSILLTGDSDWYVWKNKIVPEFKNANVLKSEILVASHHGSRSFFTETSGDNDSIDIKKYPDTTYLDALDYIKPIVTLISCAECKPPHNLPNSEALGIYKNKTGSGNDKQVLTTNDKGTLIGFIKQNGQWGITPYRFRNINNSRFNFKIICKTNMQQNVEHKSSLKKGINLKYTLKSEGGLLDPIDKLNVYWEVSNCGILEDEMHQEVYYKNKKELADKLHFTRDLQYLGRHLLCCRVKNTNKNVEITKIFIINCI